MTGLIRRIRVSKLRAMVLGKKAILVLNHEDVKALADAVFEAEPREDLYQFLCRLEEGLGVWSPQ